jgi:hypothetical protein
VGLNNTPDRYGAHSAFLEPLRERGDLTFGGPGADLPFDPVQEPLSALFARLPAGEAPDALVWWAPEYTPLPQDIEQCPIRSVAALGDWTINFWGTAPMLAAFDLVLTDRLGVEVLTDQRAAWSLPTVSHWRMFTFDPGLHVHDAGAARDIDVFFAGNLNSEVYEERSQWIHRLTALAPRVRVHVASNVRGAEYVALLNRSRIVFNHGVRREMNMRAYEAAACGALLFQERDNREIGEVFEDRRHCVLYDGDDLEALLGHYLAHEDERRGIADAARARVQEETAAHHLDRLEAHVKGLAAWGPATRPLTDLSPAERAWRLGNKAVLSCGHHAWVAAARMLLQIEDPAYRGRVTGTLAAIYGTLARHESAPERHAAFAAVARGWSEQALAADAGDPMHHLRAAELALDTADSVAAARHLELAVALAGRPGPALESLPLPYWMDAARVALDEAAAAGPHAFREGSRRLVLARALHRLGALLEAAGRRADAAVALRASVEAWPDLAGNTLLLAHLLGELVPGSAEAAQLLRRFIARRPFDFAAQEQLADLFTAAGRPQESKAVLNEALRVLRLLSVTDED